MALESFYGGKPGVSPVIKGSFEFISTQDEDYKARKEVGYTKLTKQEALILNRNKFKNRTDWREWYKDPDTGVEDELFHWDDEALALFTMDECFSQASYKDVWFNELCIIDNPDLTNTHNGMLFRRTLRQAAPGDSNHYSLFAEYIGKIAGPQGMRGLRGFMGWRGFRGLTLEEVIHIDSYSNPYNLSYPIYDEQDIVDYDLETDTYSFKEGKQPCNNNLPNHYSWLVGRWSFYNPPETEDYEAWRVLEPTNEPVTDPARGETVIINPETNQEEIITLTPTVFYTKICDISFSAIDKTYIDSRGHLLILYGQNIDKPINDNELSNIITIDGYKQGTFQGQTWVKSTGDNTIPEDTVNWWIDLGVVVKTTGIQVATQFVSSENKIIIDDIINEMNGNPVNGVPTTSVYNPDFNDGINHKGEFILVEGKEDSLDEELSQYLAYWDYANKRWDYIPGWGGGGGSGSNSSVVIIDGNNELPGSLYRLPVISLETESNGNSVPSSIVIWNT